MSSSTINSEIFSSDLADSVSFIDQSRAKLEKLEDIRLQKLKNFQWRKKMAIPIGAILTPVFGFIDYWLVMLQRGNEDAFAGLSVIVLSALWGWVTQPKRQYTRAYKTEILPDIARLFGDFTYDPKGKIPMEAMKPSKIIPNYTSYRSEDYFSGTYKNIGIDFSEILLRKKSGKSTVTVFKGLAVLLTNGTRPFHGHTILTRDNGNVGSWFTQIGSGLKHVDLVDPEFEKLFDVYSSDQTEARYLIDPMIVENLKSLYKEYNGKNMRAAFYDESFLILIASNENHFEPADIHTPATTSQSLISLKREIGQIISIVERLSLYDPKKRSN